MGPAQGTSTKKMSRHNVHYLTYCCGAAVKFWRSNSLGLQSLRWHSEQSIFVRIDFACRFLCTVQSTLYRRSIAAPTFHHFRWQCACEDIGRKFKTFLTFNKKKSLRGILFIGIKHEFRSLGQTFLLCIHPWSWPHCRPPRSWPHCCHILCQTAIARCL